MNLFDLHCDTASELYAQKKSLAENDLHIDLARLCAFPCCAQIFAVWTPPELSGKERTDHALRVIDYFRNELEKNSRFIALCTSAKELDQTLAAGKVAALLGIEGGGALDGSLENLHRLHSLGVRVLTLTWNGKNELGAGNPDPDGLSPFGEKALAEMEALGVIADLSHANPATFRGALEHSSQPLIASHSNASEVFDHPRNLFPADRARIAQTEQEMYTVNLGGTAVGTVINVSPSYFSRIVPNLRELTGYPLQQAADLFDATENLDGFVAISGVVKTCAVDLSKMCNDLRLLSSGPKTGFGEINLPAKQNGSSIMPGKVNPVIPEVVSQVAFHIVGHDATITMAAEAGQLELNAFEPVVFCNLFDSISTLTNACATLIDNCITGITANRNHCKDLMESSAGIATALCPYIGYKAAAAIAKNAVRTGRSVRSLVLEQKLMNKHELEKVLDPYRMTQMRSGD